MRQPGLPTVSNWQTGLARFIAILTFSRRTESITGRAKVIDGDTIVVAGELVPLHGIDAA